MDISAYTPSEGVLTWSNEGTEGGKYNSRVLSVPSDSSGLTIGRGYDMKDRSQSAINADLVASGVPADKAKLISGAAGLSGKNARDFIAKNNLGSFELDPAAQQKLFELDYSRMKADTIRLCTKQDVEVIYGKCDWDKIDKPIQELLVDMRYRGDYSPHMRKKIQKAAIRNDYKTILDVLGKKENFGNIDDNRFNQRKDFLFKAAEFARVNSSLK